MGIALVIMTLFAIVFAVGFTLAMFKCLEFAEKIEELGEQVDESLDIIDDCYKRISQASETPVTSDDPVVQQFVSDVKRTKDALLLIANKVIVFDTTEEDNNL